MPAEMRYKEVKRLSGAAIYRANAASATDGRTWAQLFEAIPRSPQYLERGTRRQSCRKTGQLIVSHIQYLERPQPPQLIWNSVKAIAGCPQNDERSKTAKTRP